MLAGMHVAAIQLHSTADLDANLEQAATLAEQAKAQGAELLTLPEDFAYLGNEHDRLRLAEVLPPKGQTPDGKIGRWLAALAKLHQIPIIASGMPERGPDPEHSFNTAVHIAADGTLQASYRKIHLFDVALSDGTTLQESKHTAAGDTPVVTTLGETRCGLAICYDLRFPELFRRLTDTRLVVLGAAFTLHTGRDHWLTLLKARAIENQIYVVAPAQWGRHDSKRVSFGRSAIIDPWGNVLAQAPDRPSVIVAELDFTAQDAIRQGLPALKHRRL